MKLFTDYYSRARGFGKRTVADQLTQASLLNMKVGETMCLASIKGIKYFKCIEPPKRKLNITFDSMENT